MPGIFICYRRDDSAGFAGRLYDRLAAQFGESRVFIDIDARIPPGQDFVKVIEKRVSSCDVLVALMGKRWLTARRARQRRIDDPMDFVRLEIETALNRKIPVIPALLEGASMARADQLPDSLATLPHHQAVQITHERFDEDIKRFVASIEELVKPPIAEESVSAESPTQVDTAPVVAAQEPEIVEPGTVRTNPKDSLEYVWIAPGAFQMGAVEGDDQATAAEKPKHPVTISKGLWLSRGPVTVEAYQRFVNFTGAKMPAAPDFNSGWGKQDHPIVKVSWVDAVAYCEWAGGRLPTEAEWEYAARGGKDGFIYPWGNEISKKNANYHPSDGPSSVGSYPANVFGLYDMAGNVQEWCSDWYDEGYYSKSPDTDPPGRSHGPWRVLRGGSWDLNPRNLRASSRNRLRPGYRYLYIGFRCVRVVISP